MCERRWKTWVRARGVVSGEWETKRNKIFILDYSAPPYTMGARWVRVTRSRPERRVIT